jgi:ADP-heptose:LPS heptosyltransferase
MPRFNPTSEEIERVQTILNQTANRPVARPIVLLNPNASDLLPLRKWDTDRFVMLGKNLLLAYPSLTVIITGAPSERPAAEKMCAEINSPRALCVAGKTTLRELIVLYTMADILATNDSGPGHFASLTDIDSVVMFGPETPELFGALGDRTHILWANLACSPCVNVFNHRFSPCQNNVCMKAISETDVFAKVQTLLWKRYPLKETVPLQSTTREVAILKLP